MNRADMRYVALLGVCLSFAVAATAQGFEFHVAVDGDDKGAGTAAAPFASVARARDAIRVWKAREGLPVGGVKVVIHGGRYFLEEPLAFGPEDSGTEAAAVVYAAAEGEKAILSGGRSIRGWKKTGENRWEVMLPEVKAGAWYFRQLFARGKRLTRARTPNDGYFLTAGALSEYADRAKKRYGGYGGVGPLRKNHPDAFCGFSFNEGDIGEWSHPEDAEIITYHSWECSWQSIRGIDFEKRDLHFNTPCRYPIGFFSLKARYRVENVLEALDLPGEWHLSRKTGVLTYLARPGEDPNTMDFIAPRLEKLLILQGGPDGEKPVQHIAFSGLSLRHARYPMGICDVARDWPKEAQAVIPDWPSEFPPGYTDAQASPRCGQAIDFKGTKYCALLNCEIAHVGASAVRIDRWSHENRVEGCHIYDLGGGGVFCGMDVREVEKSNVPREAAPSRNTIANNRINDGGIVHPSAVGIWIAQSHHNTIAHNELYNWGYSGISLGWTWNREPNYSDHNTIEANHIHHVLQALADGGGIYTLGVLEGCVLRGNHIHDIQRPEGAIGSHNNGFFFDQGSQKLLCERNVIHAIGHHDVRFNQCKREDHTWVDNVFEEEGGDVGSREAKAVIAAAGPLGR